MGRVTLESVREAPVLYRLPVESEARGGKVSGYDLEGRAVPYVIGGRAEQTERAELKP